MYHFDVAGPLNLVTIQARSWDLLVEWYRDVLKLVPVTIEHTDRFAMFSTGDGGAMIAIASDHPEQTVSNAENRLAPGFLVGEFESTIERLRSEGARATRSSTAPMKATGWLACGTPKGTGSTCLRMGDRDRALGSARLSNDRAGDH